MGHDKLIKCIYYFYAFTDQDEKFICDYSYVKNIDEDCEMGHKKQTDRIYLLLFMQSMIIKVSVEKHVFFSRISKVLKLGHTST